MIAPAEVTTAVMFPHTCRGCGAQKGPFIDYMVSDRVGRLYLCVSLCVKTGAQISGMASGKKLDELAHAAAAVSEKEREIEVITKELSVLKARFGDISNSDRVKNDQIEELRARVRQLEGEIRKSASHALAFVGGEAA